MPEGPGGVLGGMTDPLGALIVDPYCVDPADAVGEQIDMKHDIETVTAGLARVEQRFVR